METTSEQQATDPSTSPAKLQNLAKTSMELARLVAKNENAAPELLQELASSSDKDIRKAVASNPNTPTEVLLKLGADFPEQLLNNPVFSLLFLENLNLADTIPTPTLRSLIKYENVPLSLLQKAAENSDSTIQLALAMNAQTPKTALEKLIKSKQDETVEAALLHVNWAGEIAEGWEEVAKKALGKSMDFKYIEQLVEIGLIPELAIEVIWNSEQYSIEQKVNLLEKVTQNPDKSKRILQNLAPVYRTDGKVTSNCKTTKKHSKSDRWLSKRLTAHLHRIVASNPHTPERILEQLAKDKDESVRKAVASNPNTPGSLLAHLAKDDVVSVRAKVASHPNISEGVMKHLARDSQDYNWEIRYGLTHNPKTPGKILEQLIEDLEQLVENEQIDQQLSKNYYLLPLAVAMHPNISTAMREHLFDTTVPETLAQIEQHKNKSRRHNFETIEILIEIILKYPQVPGKVLEQLVETIQHQSKSEMHDFAAFALLSEIILEYPLYPQIPAKVLEQLVGLLEPNLFTILVAQHPNTPQSLLEQWAVEEPNLRDSVALNPNTPEKILEKFATGKNRMLRKEVAKNPKLPVSLLEQLAQDKYDKVRQSVAENPNAPINILAMLRGKPHTIIFDLVWDESERDNSYNFGKKSYLRF